jgi:hypothetical protein
MHHVLTLGGMLLGLAGLTLVLVSASWRLRPALDRVGSSHLRGVLLLAFALSALVILRIGDWIDSSTAYVLGLAILVGVGVHVVANVCAPAPETRVTNVRRTLFRGVSCLAVSFAAFSQQGRVKQWQVERDLHAIRRNAAPLVASLHAFRVEFDRWPQSKEEFIGSAGSKIADGLGRVRWRIDGCDVCEECLVVDYSGILSGSDYFAYAPGVEFRDDLPAQRFGDWVYYNE